MDDRWTVRAGWLLQMWSCLPAFAGTLAACLIALAVLTPFGLAESTAAGKVFPIWICTLLLALCWCAVAMYGIARRIARGVVTVEYTLKQDTLYVTEIDKRNAHKTVLPLKDAKLVRKTKHGIILRVGKRHAYVLCGAREREKLANIIMHVGA